MRASGSCELRTFLHFHIQTMLFLSIFCWYFRNFVDTIDILVGLHVPTYFQMYRQNSEKSIMGGNFSLLPTPPAPPPPLATLVAWNSGCFTFEIMSMHIFTLIAWTLVSILSFFAFCIYVDLS